jgi:hypothetical protein
MRGRLSHQDTAFLISKAQRSSILYLPHYIINLAVVPCRPGIQISINDHWILH